MQDLLELALDRPDEAHLRATEALALSRDPLTRSFAHQSLGIVLRDRGEIPAALRHLRTGLREAEASGRADRAGDVRATLGTALAYGGRTREALAHLQQARAGASGEAAARIALREAGVLSMLGRHRESIELLRPVVTEMQRVGDGAWEARARLWLGNCELEDGQVAAAEANFAAAAVLLADQGAWVDRVSCLANLAEVARTRGDLPDALRRYGEVVADYHRTGSTTGLPLIIESYAEAYLAAGLAADAVDLTNEAAQAMTPLSAASFGVVAARAHLAAGDPAGAVAAAERVAPVLHRQGRTWYELRARWEAVQGRVALGTDDPRPRLAAEAAAVAAALDEEAANEAPLALVVAGRLQRGEERRRRWERAASYRQRAPALVRAAGWQAEALLGEHDDRPGAALRAAGRGLDAIDEHRRLMGSTEMRAVATTHGRDLAAIALRQASGDPRTLLRWAERVRATMLHQAPATSQAATIPPALAALRDNGRLLVEARQEGEDTSELDRERRRLERAVRKESFLAVADAPALAPPPVGEIVAAVGDDCLVELVEVDGVLHVLVVHGGRVRRRVAGRTADVMALLGPAQMLLRRAARGRAVDLTALGGQLQQAVLGDAVGLIPEGPVVLAPTTRLHGLPWALLPTFADRPFSVVPSAGQWLRARARTRPRNRRTVLVAGPGLATGGAEVPLLAAAHPDAVLLAGPDATLVDVLDRLDGADLVHLAAHGHFRADSPLFSSLDLADGPLTVHDLERVRRAPYRVVLSACESGVLAPVGAEELLGLAAALFSLGTAGLVCSVAEVNDAATADLMVALHASLAAGDSAGEALLAVRRTVAGEAVAVGTAAAFVALGV